MQNQLFGALVGLARCIDGNENKTTNDTYTIIRLALLACKNNQDVQYHLEQVIQEKKRIVPECFQCQSPCGKRNDFDITEIQKEHNDIQVIKYDLLKELIRLATITNEEINTYLYYGLFSIGYAPWTKEGLQPLLEAMQKI